MCGITGYWDRQGQAAGLRDDLPVSVDSLDHRGPDDRGVWYGEGGVGLGHTRLSILDLSSRAHQPMLSEDGRLAMVYNGEVYNFRDIRSALESCGHHFRGEGDTEVLLAAFHEWGESAVEKFIGMFAIALWDTRERSLTLFRDRLGVKPLYYGWDGRVLWFGSELRALRAFRHWSPDMDRTALGEFFQYAYISAPRSIYRQVRKLSPGHRLSLKSSGEPSVESYWSLPAARVNGAAVDERALEEELEGLLVDAFSYRMVSDVPVGVFLSGGIDSSVVAALLQRSRGERLHTFTIGFGETAFDESDWARRVAEHLGTEHHETRLSAARARAIVPDWAEIYDEPFGDASGIPTFLVSEVARRDVKVALSADGGDELFAGYDNYFSLPRRIAALKRLPRWVRALSSSLLSDRVIDALSFVSPHLPFDRRGKLVDRFRKLKLALPDLREADFFDLALSFWTVPEINHLVGGDASPRYASPRWSLDHYAGAYEERMMRWDLDHYLPEDILAKVDRASMAVGLEGREPLLDHRVVEFAFRLPLSLRLGSLGTKHLLRKILYRHVPRELIDRPKQGFGIPLRDWLLGDLSELLDTYLDPRRIRDAGILNPSMVEKYLRDFRRGRRIDVGRIWLLLVFEMWRERWG